MSNCTRKREKKYNNGIKRVPEIIVVTSSSGSEESNEEEEEEEEAKSSNNSNQNMNEEAMEESKEEADIKRKNENISTGRGVGSCCFPTNRIKRIVRSEGTDFRTSHEALFLINKATEQFLELFCQDAYGSVVQDHKKAVGYKHLSSVVCKRKRYDFLSDFVPEKIKAEDALSESRLAGT